MRLARRLLVSGTIVAMAGVLLAACDGGTNATVQTGPPTTTPGVTLATVSSPAGPVLATGTGHTLYDYSPDTPGHSACVTSVCVTVWPPLIVTGHPTVGKGLQPALAGTVRRPGGALQASYGGHPLYTWKGDGKPGMITGQALLNAGGYWYVIAPSGQQITTQFTVRR
ncbi:MAG: COG4315 family predicted lipoprotein [Acidimicrobiales bacterium]